MAKGNEPVAAAMEPKPPAVAVYTVEELAQAAHQLKLSRDCVVAALRVAGKAQATMEEAKRLVVEFCKKEVK